MPIVLIGIAFVLGIGAYLLNREILVLRRERRVLESVVSSLLDGYDPDLEQDAWIKVLWYPSGDPPEREGHPMSAAEREVIERLMPVRSTGRREHG